jgi:uncharacterized membrane protein YkvA (DUF1232 family)
MFTALKRTAASLKRDMRVYQAVRRDARTPRRAKILLGLAIAYFVCPIDLIPDFIPVIGHLDDAIIVPLFVVLALRSIPEEVLAGARETVEREPNTNLAQIMGNSD